MPAFGKRAARALAVVAGSVSLLAGTIGVADAATARNGICETGEFCLYYLSGLQGSVSDFAGSVPNYGTTQPTCYDFKGPGAGQGQCVKNNALSARNLSSRPVTVYFNSNYMGTGQTYAAGTSGNLIPALANNNASHLFG